MRIIALALFLAGISCSLHAQVVYGTQPVSKISTELEKSQVAHTLEIWQLEKMRGINKIELVIEAVRYSALNSTDELKGIRFKFVPEAYSSPNGLTQSFNQFEGILDNTEYSEIMVVLKQIIDDFKKKDSGKKSGSMNYKTKSGIKVGYNLYENKEVAYISVLYSNAEISCEFSNIEKSLIEIRDLIDIASKDLYLPENAEKLKNAKKSNQEAKDVIIDDI